MNDTRRTTNDDALLGATNVLLFAIALALWLVFLFGVDVL